MALSATTSGTSAMDDSISKTVDYEKNELNNEALEKQVSRPAHVDQAGRPVLTVEEVGGAASQRALNFKSIYAMVVFGCSSFMFGYDNGIIGSLVSLPDFVRKYQGSALNGDGLLAFTARNQNLLFSVPLVGSIFGAILATPLQNYCGRKWGLVYAYAFSIGGVLLQLFAPSLAAFVIGRFWNALSYGAATAIVPLLLGDIVPPSIRGAAVQASSIAAIGSGVIGNLVIFGTDKIQGPWSYHVPLIIQAVFPVFLAIMTVFCVESPTWYVQKGRIDQARKTLRSIRAYSDAQVDDELRIIVNNETNQRELTGDVKFWDIFHKSQLKRTITAGSLFSLNQISGIILSTTYATIFLQQLKIGNPFSLAVIASCTQLAGSLTAPFVVDRAGRRPLALVGFSCLFVIDMAAGGLAFDGSVGARKGVAALGFIFNFVWCCSFYSLSLLMPSEIATPRLRAATMSYAVGWGQTTAVITTFAVPQLTQPDAANLGPKTYLVFGGCMACIIVFVYFFLPETAKRTFAEIDEMYEANRAGELPMRKWKKFETSPESKLAKVVDDIPTVHL